MQRAFLIIAALALSASCTPPREAATSSSSAGSNGGRKAPGKVVEPNKLATRFLPNVVRIHPRVISGGLPASDEAFEELGQLGVKTIISVDGAKPDVAAANKHGLRYVHLPHGYDGIPEKRARELAKAVRELEGPIYIHCHHGKHRSPAAASVACVTAGLIPESQALAILEIAGTSPNYRGLYRSAEQARALEAQLLDELQVEFRATVEVPPMAEAMVALEHTHDHLKAIQAAGWKTPAKHPDLDPAHEALLLQEHFTELLRTEAVQRRPGPFRTWLEESEQAARQLEQELNTAPQNPLPAKARQRLDQFAARITANCKQCHTTYRDTPL